MLIRPAESKDYQAYCALTLEADALHAGWSPRYYRKTAAPSRPLDFFENLLRDSGKAMFVAEEGGRVVGVVNLEVRQDPDLPPVVPMRWVQVAEVIVDGKHQRKGIGKALMAQAAKWAAGKGCDDLRLSVTESNATAKDFYRSIGFGVKHQVLALPLEAIRKDAL